MNNTFTCGGNACYIAVSIHKTSACEIHQIQMSFNGEPTITSYVGWQAGLGSNLLPIKCCIACRQFGCYVKNVNHSGGHKTASYPHVRIFLMGLIE